MLVKSSILVHANSIVSLSPLLSSATLSLCLPACLPLCLLSFRFRTFYRAAVPTHVRNRPRFSPTPYLLSICSGLCHSLSKSNSSHPITPPFSRSLGLGPGRSHLRVDWIPHACNRQVSWVLLAEFRKSECSFVTKQVELSKPQLRS